MENVKFIEYKEFNGIVEYYFKIHDNLADWIRKNTKYGDEELNNYLSKDNVLTYRIAITNHDWFVDIHSRFIKTLEKICNENDDYGFANNLVTDNGHLRSPRAIHKIMREKYGLADVSEKENKDASYTDADYDIEWFTAHFIIFFTVLLRYPSPSDD